MAISTIGNSGLNVSAITNGSATLTLPTTSGTILAQNASAPANSLVVDSSGNVGIGTISASLFNSVGGSTRLAVCGSSASTDILGNINASICIINTDTTANNTAGLHFARADTDDTPNLAGASIVAQFPDTQVTNQYPKGLLAFLTSTNANAAPSEKMRIDSVGNLLVGTTSASVPSTTGFVSSANTFGFKNRIINGGMVIDQRNAGASVTGSTTNPFSVDRWQTVSSQNSKFTAQQNAGSVTPPAGFINYLGVTSSSAYSIVAADQYRIFQSIEGLNVADLAWGTANAATVTLSFKVYSSLTGTFGGSLANNAYARSYPFTYTISTANTWTTISVTIAGDTSGTWLTNNGNGVIVSFGLGVGSTLSGTAGAWAGAAYTSATGAVSVVGTSGATFYITGVQLEKGSVATSFDQRAYSQELAMCQRYCQTWASGEIDFIGSNAVAGNNNTFVTPLKATFRASPTWASTTFTMVNGTISTFTLTPNSFSFNVSNTSAGQWRATSTTLGILSAEL